MGYITADERPERPERPEPRPSGPKASQRQSGGTHADARVSEVIDFSETDGLSKPLRVTRDGIRIGCTYVTREAVEHIVGKWEESKKEEKEGEGGKGK